MLPMPSGRVERLSSKYSATDSLGIAASVKVMEVLLIRETCAADMPSELITDQFSGA